MEASASQPDRLGLASGGDIAQTLDRGLAVLDLLLGHPDGLSVNEIGEHLGVARSISRRLVTTLVRRHLLSEVSRGRFQLGAKLVELGARVEPHLRAISEPILRESAATADATAVLSVADGESAIALSSFAPPEHTIQIVWRVGERFPLDRGASGLAMLSMRPASDAEPLEVQVCRERGWATSFGELQDALSAVAAPVATRWPITASVGLVVPGSVDGARLGPVAVEAARRIAALLDRRFGA